MAIFASSSEQPQAYPADKTQMDFTEDLEATRSQSKNDEGRIERVELTPEDVGTMGVLFA